MRANGLQRTIRIRGNARSRGRVRYLGVRQDPSRGGLQEFQGHLSGHAPPERCFGPCPGRRRQGYLSHVRSHRKAPEGREGNEVRGKDRASGRPEAVVQGVPRRERPLRLHPERAVKRAHRQARDLLYEAIEKPEGELRRAAKLAIVLLGPQRKQYRPKVKSVAKSARRASVKELDALCRAVVFARDENTCRKCGKPAVDWSHVITRGT